MEATIESKQGNQSEIGRLNTQPIRDRPAQYAANQLKATDLTVSNCGYHPLHKNTFHYKVLRHVWVAHTYWVHVWAHGCIGLKIRVVYAYTGYIHLTGIHIWVTFTYWVCISELHTLTGYAYTGYIHLLGIHIWVTYT